MIRTITVVNHLSESVVLNLRSPEQSGFFIRGVDGLGPTKATINTTESLALDGATFNSARQTLRNIVFNLGFLEKPTIEDTRQQSYRYFPLKKQIEIFVETDNRTTKTQGYVESNEPNIFSRMQTSLISVICPDPYFRSVDKITVEFSSTQSLFEFPFSNESVTEKLIIFGNLELEPQKNIFYSGDSAVGIKMYVHALGSVGTLSIYNIETGQVMTIDADILEALTGSPLVAGDDLVISTARGDKYVHLIRDGVTTNVLNALGGESPWIVLEKGDNNFYFTASFGGELLEFTVEYENVYEGI